MIPESRDRDRTQLHHACTAPRKDNLHTPSMSYLRARHVVQRIRPSHACESNLSPWQWPPVRLPSISEPHRWPRDRPGLGRQEALGWKAEWYGSAAPGTNCLSWSQRRSWREASRLTLEDVQTDTPQLVDIGMVDLGQEADLGWSHGIVVR